MTDETFSGTVTGVYALDLGDKLSQAAAVSATLLHVYSVVDFDEAGGTLRLNGVVLDYESRDAEALTILLSAPLATAAAVDDVVEVWDAANGQPATVYKAVLDDVDGFSGNSIEAYVPQSVAHVLSTTMREGKGETVTLARDQGALEVLGVQGRQFALAALQYLQGGMTTRQTDDDTGVDILGADSGTPGVYIIGAAGNMILLRDDGSAGLIEFWTGQVGETPGSINPGMDNTGGNSALAIKMTTGSIGGSQAATVWLVGQGALETNRLWVKGTTRLDCDNGIQVNAGGIEVVGGNVEAATGDVIGTRVFATNPGTTTNAANVWFGVGGQLQKVTSLSRHKLDPQEITLEDALAILRLGSSTWFDRAEVEANGGSTEGLRRIPGHLAEDVERHVPALALYDEHDELQGVAYDRAPAYLIPVVRHLHDENADLRVRVERLEALVAKLTKET